MPHYAVRRSKKARTMRLAIYPDGAVVVTAPNFFGLAAIERFVAHHSAWVQRKVAESHGRTVIHIRRADIPRLKRDALALAEHRAAHFAARYGVTYAKVSIRAQKTRWGSCSRTGNLSFNYKMATLRAELVDYIVVHEICHRLAFDHSKRFWDLVAREIPAHRALRTELRTLAFMHS